MSDIHLRQLSPLQRILLLICLVIAVFFLAPLLIALGGLVAAYYGYSLYKSTDVINKILSLLLIFFGLIIFLSFGFPYALPVLGFIILDRLLTTLGYPSLWLLVRQLVDGLISAE